jgi:hypothetical protein
MGDERLAIQEEILKLVTSEEAERVTRYISLIYLRLVRAPCHLWEREHVLRFTREFRDGHPVSAWDQLIALVKVSPRTAKRALSWLHDKEVIALYTTDDRTEIIIALNGLSS